MMADVPQPLVGHARARPHHLALCDGTARGGRRFTYAQLAVHSGRVACALLDWGVRPQGRVALLGAHGLDYALAIHALGLIDVVVVPLPQSATPEALLGRLMRAHVAACIVLPGANARVMQPAPAQSPCHFIPWQSLVSFDGDIAKATEARPWPMDGARLLLETSGTSGTPTEVMLTTGNIVMQSLGSVTRLGHRIDDMWLCVLPLHHVGGLMVLYRALILGASVCVPGGFDADETVKLLHQVPISLTSLVPTMLARLLPELRRQGVPASLRAVLLGGAPTPQTLFDAARDVGVPVALTWGMTEACSSICVRWPHTEGGESSGHSARNAGPPLPFIDVSCGADGALHIAGPSVMGEGRHLTSDWGDCLADGTVAIRGRRDRIIISGGENIAAEELEAVLLSHPDIADAAVVGRADEHWGERPHAHLVARAAPVPDHDLVAFCRARLASFQIPVRFVWHDKLPRDAIGKLQRTALLDAAAGVLRQ